MYLNHNLYVLENVAAQLRNERLQEAALERSLKAARNEPRPEPREHDTHVPAGSLRRAWGALHSLVSFLA